MTTLHADELEHAIGGAANPTSSAWLSAQPNRFRNNAGIWGLPRSLAEPSAGSWYTPKEPAKHSRLWTGVQRTDVRF